MAWNYGDILDRVAPVLPASAPALIHEDRVISWAETARRSNNLGRALLERGAKANGKVAFYMRNRSEYMETLAACFKSRLVHVNINYRYKPDEVSYILDDSDAQTIVYGTEFRDTIGVGLTNIAGGADVATELKKATATFQPVLDKSNEG